MRHERRPAEAGGERQRVDEEPSSESEPAKRRQRGQPEERGQLGLQLQRRGARGEGDRCPGHLECNAPLALRLTVPRKYFRKYLPNPEVVRSSRTVTRFGRWLQHPNLWHLNRRSVSGAVAIGLFSGLVPGPLQMLTALLLAIRSRRICRSRSS